MKIKSLVLVIIQVAGIVILCVTARPVCTKIPLIALQTASFVLIVWTMWHLRPGKFHILPDALKSTELITGGPFRWIRHPMYLSLFLYLVPLVIEYYNWWRLLVLLIFLVNMIIKLLYEEKFLQQKFPEYVSYMKRSKRLIPFIF